MDSVQSSARVAKYHRVTLACNNCRRRKKRCDAQKPVCSSCASSGENCKYDRVPPLNHNDWRYDRLNAKLGRIEDILESLVRGKSLSVASSNSSVKSEESEELGEAPTVVDGLCAEKGSEIRSAPSFMHRLKDLMAQTVLEDGGLAYTSGVFLSILCPNEIERLSVKLKEPNLSHRLTSISNQIWRMQQESGLRLVDHPKDAVIDPRLVEFCHKIHIESIELSIQRGRMSKHHRTGFLLRTFLSKDDLEGEGWEKAPAYIRDARSAALVIEGALALKIDAKCKGPSIYGEFTPEYVESQKRIAMYEAIKMLNLIRFSRPTLDIVRIGFLTIWLLGKSCCVPAVEQYMPLLIKMARLLMLDRDDVNIKYPIEEATLRVIVWRIMVFYQYHIAILAFERPFVDDESYELPLGDRATPSDFSIAIHQIYSKAQRQLSDILHTKHSPEQIYRDIIQFDKDLTAWWGELKGHFDEIVEGTPENPTFVQWMNDYPMWTTHRRYHHARILIHYIPAFYPCYLPRVMELPSLDLVAESARELLKASAIEAQVISSCTLGLALSCTAAVGTLLYKQLRYPQHETNAEDFKLLQTHIKIFDVETWPTIVDGDNPILEIWQALLDIVSGLDATDDQGMSGPVRNAAGNVPKQPVYTNSRKHPLGNVHTNAQTNGHTSNSSTRHSVGNSNGQANGHGVDIHPSMNAMSQISTLPSALPPPVIPPAFNEVFVNPPSFADIDLYGDEAFDEALAREGNCVIS